MIFSFRFKMMWACIILSISCNVQSQANQGSKEIKSVLMIKAAGVIEGGEAEGVDAITEATSVGRNVHVITDALHKVLQSNGVESEVVQFNDTKRIQQILNDSTVQLIVFAGPAYSSQFPQQLKNVVPKLKDYILQNKIHCTSMTCCRFLDSGGRTVKSFNKDLKDHGIQTIDGLAIHHEYEDQDWESKIKAFAEELQKTLQTKESG